MQDGQKGFTLVEVLVALALMAALAVGLTLVVTQVLDARNQLSEVRANGRDGVVSFLTRVDRQLSQLVPRQIHLAGEKVGDGGLEIKPASRELSWVSGGQWALPLEDYSTRLRLWRVRWEEESQTLYLETSGLLDAVEERIWTAADQLHGVMAVDWAFYYPPAWQPDPVAGSLPSGVRLQLTREEGEYQRLTLLPEVRRARPATTGAGQ
ncbi:type II secretion system minor pseudopilin GspJ [Marinospirillum perlucidum]|uniref:type II secretion system minor pseudopilin GspJ n=1 Tax=Marinospirillum perlucidum TaxID=1982602 RepID=UPI00138FC540|nr:type II secretion system minor pseudopilin GspJ [Marinospirillum perlucidum]